MIQIRICRPPINPTWSAVTTVSRWRLIAFGLIAQLDTTGPHDFIEKPVEPPTAYLMDRRLWPRIAAAFFDRPESPGLINQSNNTFQCEQIVPDFSCVRISGQLDKSNIDFERRNTSERILESQQNTPVEEFEFLVADLAHLCLNARLPKTDLDLLERLLTAGSDRIFLTPSITTYDNRASGSIDGNPPEPAIGICAAAESDDAIRTAAALERRGGNKDGVII
jgi:hypothetical protein